MICLRSHLRDKDKKVKNENYGALFLKAFTATITTEYGARKDVFCMIKTSSWHFKMSPFPEMGKSFRHITSCFREDKLFFCNKLEKLDLFKVSFQSINFDFKS